MARIRNKAGKYPEEAEPFNTQVIMQDDKFLLMQQCIRDARELHIMVRHFSNYDELHLAEWQQYEQDVLLLAQTFFRERIKNPVSQETMKRVMLASSSATQTLQDISVYHEELLVLVENINKMTLEQTQLKETIKSQKQEVADLRSVMFLTSTIGEVRVAALEKDGFINLPGTNGATYKLTKDGFIYKTITKSRFFRPPVEEQVGFGRIQDAGGLPMNDAIAIIYAHISSDSDKFDKDKACGAIRIRGSYT